MVPRAQPIGEALELAWRLDRCPTRRRPRAARARNAASSDRGASAVEQSRLNGRRRRPRLECLHAPSPRPDARVQSPPPPSRCGRSGHSSRRTRGAGSGGAVANARTMARWPSASPGSARSAPPRCGSRGRRWAKDGPGIPALDHLAAVRHGGGELGREAPQQALIDGPRSQPCEPAAGAGGAQLGASAAASACEASGPASTR